MRSEDKSAYNPVDAPVPAGAPPDGIGTYAMEEIEIPEGAGFDGAGTGTIGTDKTGTLEGASVGMLVTVEYTVTGDGQTGHALPAGAVPMGKGGDGTLGPVG